MAEEEKPKEPKEPKEKKLKKPRFGKVEKLQPNSKGINLMLKCVSCKEVENVGGPTRIWEAVVGDDTGIVTLQIRSEEQAALERAQRKPMKVQPEAKEVIDEKADQLKPVAQNQSALHREINNSTRKIVMR